MPWTALETAVPFCIVILVAILITRAVYNKPDLTPEDVRIGEANASTTLGRARAQIEAARRERNQAIASVVSAHQERDAARDELRESEAGRRTLAKDLSACRDNVAALQASAARSLAETKSLRAQLDDCQTTVFDAKTTIDYQEKLVNNHKARIVALEAEEREIKRTHEQIEATLTKGMLTLSEENAKLKDEYVIFEEKYAKLEEAHRRCLRELAITRGGFVQNR